MTQVRNHPGLPALAQPGLWKALCDPNRVAILGFLARNPGPRTVTEVADSGCLKVDLSVVSRHLATLRDAGVVVAERHGREVRYTLQVRPLVATLRALADALEGCCGGAS
jgi:DNA-binding transcriptional ArsR family regulator